ncbi:MAG: peptidoglycan bridge formation glycyltransferase FemA/FemB family protein [Ornithinimicrobium sp.]|uniref:lipid II:glycine glycyltransferase FemX n=1 Tax=Ornithinimicrobium sp. TaxID=1977084 RepID=UPI0026DFD4EA|nr:peptidoglycan bridge formation glycyltransferase FemA/FemB family protein [Ornithinimicrobium sp.]MDO5739210.1 peptidoglycan bridge formation glycyltransferase FemA/FemB family protein [Ornithinimicrobium sp.]
MPVLDPADAAELERYDQFVRSHPHRALTQDVRWGIVKDDWGQEAVYVEEGGRIVSAMTVLVRRLPGGFSVLYAPRGPLVDWDDEHAVASILAEAAPLATKHRAIMTRMDPEIRFDDALDSWMRTQPGWVVKNVGAGKDDLIQPRYNMVVALKDAEGNQLTEEELLRKYNSTTRSRVRAGLRKGVEMSLGSSEEDLRIFYDVYSQMARRKEITARDATYFERMREAFGDRMHIAVARHEGDVLAVAILIDYYGKLSYLYAGSSDVKRNLYGSNVLNHALMAFGLDHGAESYDLGGVFALDSSDGLYVFKRAFAKADGATELIGEIDIVHRKLAYAALATALPRMQHGRRMVAARLSQAKKRRAAAKKAARAHAIPPVGG